MIIAITPLGLNDPQASLPLLITAPALSRTVIVPRASLFRHPVSPGLLQTVRGLFLKLLETAYHSLSPSPSRRSGRPKRCHGSRPTAPPAHGVSAVPSSSKSGQGRSPGRGAPPAVKSIPAANPINASLAFASAAAVFLSLS